MAINAPYDAKQQNKASGLKILTPKKIFEDYQ